MKKIILSALLFSTLILMGCTSVENNNQNSNSKLNTSYIMKNEKGNYIWGGAMNLAWNELADNIINDEIKLDTKDIKTLKTTKLLNESSFTTNDLDSKSYYVKSGYGQKTVDLINKESKEKFPNKSFKDLDIVLYNDEDVISYAYFLKEIEYKTKFKEEDIFFNNEKVKGFFARNNEQKENVNILKYWNDNKFIISLNLKNNSDEIFLIKGFNKNKQNEIVELINKNIKNIKPISEDDYFSMPKLHIDYHYDYKEIIGKSFLNKGFTGHSIGVMYENLKFDMDEVGAKVENEGVISMVAGASPYQKQIKYKSLILNKPFTVIMKRSNSQNPYFILVVNNSEIMEK